MPRINRNKQAQPATRPMAEPLMLDKHAVKELVCMPDSTLYWNIKHRGFPRPVKYGRASRWIRSEVIAWLEQAAAQREVAA